MLQSYYTNPLDLANWIGYTESDRRNKIMVECQGRQGGENHDTTTDKANVQRGEKKQLVELYKHGKPRSEIIREYDLTASAFDQ